MSEPIDPIIRDRDRLRALRSTELLDSPAEATFDRLTRLAAKLLRAPVALVSLVDEDRQFFKSAVGLSEPWATCRETPLSHSFCKHVVASSLPLVVPDARLHDRLSENQAIRNLGVLAYLGMPLADEEGQPLGSFCVIDSAPREWDENEIELLGELAGAVESEIRFAAKRARLKKIEDRLSVQNAVSAALSELPDLDSGIAEILAIIGSGLGFHAAQYWIARKALGALTLHTAFWSSEEFAGKSIQSSPSMHLKRGEGLAGTVWEGLQPVCIEDLSRPGETVCVRADSLLQIGLHGAVGFPVQNEEGLIGVVTLFSRKPLEADALMRDGLQALGRKIGQFAARRQAESELRDRESLLSIILDNIPAAVFVKDSDGRYLRGNREFAAKFGMTPEQVVGKSDFDLFPPNIARERLSFDREVLRGDRTVESERVIPCGTTAVHEIVRELPLHGREGQILGVLVVATDVTELKEFERRIAERESMLRQLGDNLPSGAIFRWIETPDGLRRFTYLSAGFESTTGISAEEAMRDSDIVIERMVPEEQASFDQAVADAVLQPIRFNYEFRLRLPSGSIRWIHIRALPQQLADGTVAWDGVLLDVTEAKSVEEKLRLAWDQAETANRAKSEFLANMSHEVRTPIAAVLGHADMLLDPHLPAAESQVAVQSIRRNGKHLLSILDDILDLAKIEAGRLELEPISHSPWQILLEVDSLLSVQASERKVGLRIEPVTGLPRSAVLDPTRVRQVLVNLVSNAVKFSPPGGDVRVRIGAKPPAGGQPGEIFFEVEDQGIGMTPEQLQRVFLPFQQADSSTSRRFGGTGLGLSITTRLVEAMGGTLNAVSELGQGSCFTVRLPLRLPDNERTLAWLSIDDLAKIHVEPLTDYQIPAGLRLSGRVLLAEDSEDNRRVLLHLLRRFGIEAAVVCNGREALEMALANPFDLLLMDMQMPEMDGYAATQALRRAGYLHPIVALTAHALSEDRNKCLDAGCTEFLAKPVDLGLLSAVLQRFLRRGDPEGLPMAEDARPPDVAHAASLARVAAESENLSPNRGNDPSAAVVSELGLDPGMSELLRDYVASLPEQVANIRSAMNAGDQIRVGQLAHRLRGVGGMYGYPELTELGGLIEDAVREDQGGDLLTELVGELEILVSRVLAGLPARGDFSGG